MKLGKINFFLLPFFLYFVSYSILNAEDSISTTPLINLENLELLLKAIQKMYLQKTIQ